jgi:hypothetical protein
MSPAHHGEARITARFGNWMQKCQWLLTTMPTRINNMITKTLAIVRNIIIAAFYAFLMIMALIQCD